MVVLNEKINLLLNDEILLNKMAENSIKLGKTDALTKYIKSFNF